MVRWSGHARSQLKQIHDYIALDSPRYAKSVVAGIVGKTELLAAYPRIGRVVPECGNENIREIPRYSWRILYEVKPSHVEVLAVIHKRRDFQAADLR